MFLEDLYYFLTDQKNFPFDEISLEDRYVYYHMIKTYDEFKSIIEDIDKHKYSIDITNTQHCRVLFLKGIYVTLHDADYDYYFVLDKDEEYLGYCTCSPNDKGYNPKYDCCGISCDWERPFILVFKIHKLGLRIEFEGLQKDMWSVIEEYEENADNSKIIKEIKEELEEIEAKIEVLEDRKSYLLSRLQKLQKE